MNNDFEIASQKSISEDRKAKIIYILKFTLIALAYGFNGTTFTGIPFLFLGNKLDCLNEKGQAYECSIEDACSNEYGYVQEKQTQYPQIHSLTMLLNIYCDRRVIEAWILTLGTFGKIIADFILVMVPLHKDRKEFFINVVVTMIGVALCSLHWFQSTAMFFFAFFIWHMGFTLFFGVIYTHILEVFPDFISKYGAGILNMFWPSMMVIYIFYAEFYGTWENTIIHITGIPLLVIGAVRFFLSTFDLTKRGDRNNQEINKITNQHESSDLEELQNQSEITSNHKLNKNDILESTNQKKDQYISQLSNQNIDPHKHESIWEKYFPFMYKGKELRTNFYVWSLGWACNYVCYVGCYYQMDTLYGDLYFNCFFSTMFEVIAGLLAMVVVVKFYNRIKEFTVWTYIITGLAFISSCFMDNLDGIIEKANNKPDTFYEISIHYLFIFFQLLPIIVAKISYEMMWTVLVTYQKNTIPIPYQQSQFSCSNFISNVAANAVPFYKYFAEKFGVNPFLGFGVFCFITAYFSKDFVEINLSEEEGDKEKQNLEDAKDIEQTQQESKNN